LRNELIASSSVCRPVLRVHDLVRLGAPSATLIGSAAAAGGAELDPAVRLAAD
jgi:hypothetical protein